MYNLTFVYLKNFFALFLDSGMFTDSGFGFPDSGFPIRGFKVALQSSASGSKWLLGNVGSEHRE